MQKEWLLPGDISPDERGQIEALAAQLKCPPMIARLLWRKGLREAREIGDFFDPKLEHQHDPFLFRDMEKAVGRILLALERGEKITIYGDYDVDGTTATTLLYLGLKGLGARIGFYIPNRMIDGYGLSLSSVDQIKEDGTSLIISVDCGVNALEEIEAINSKGMEIIVTDHHNPKDDLPQAYAIINPKLPGSTYPYPHLAGVGVAYKLLMAMYARKGIQDREKTVKYLDLVAVGTIADIVPLTGENRIFASLGLRHLIAKKNLGLSALAHISGINSRNIDTSDIVFGIAPRINAAGRMGSASEAVELLISRDKARSLELAESIERQNSLRQQEDQKTYHEACDIIEKKYKDISSVPCIVVSSDDWHPGVIGIVASKLVEKYYRPVIMISFHEGFGSGSGRSVADFDLFGALKEIGHNLYSFGGHKYAVGFTIYQEYIDRFENELSRYIFDRWKWREARQALVLDEEIELYEISGYLLDWLERFAPFGPENNRPIFHTRQVSVPNYPYNVGRNHLKLKVVKDGVVLDLIGYNLGGYLPLIKKNSLIDIAYTLEYNRFGRKSSIQGKLRDIHLN